jgi:hypothetical protein
MSSGYNSHLMNYRRLASLLLIVLCAIAVQAQSGRRQTKHPPAAPVQTPSPEPSPSPKKDEKEPELMFLVAADRSSTFESIPFTFYEAAVRGCADRLRAGSSAAVDASQRDISRSEAIKKAKAETITYVVLLSLSFDRIGRMRQTYDDLILDFVVFAPGTAKVVTTGRSYMNSNRAGPVVVGRRTPGGIFREEAVRLAGEDAGNRILKALHLNIQIPIPR